MTDLIQRFLGDGNWDVREEKGEMVICRKGLFRHGPEDCIRVEKVQGGYAVCEVHRDNRAVRARAFGESEAAVAAAVLARRMFGGTPDQTGARWIRAYMDQGHEDQAVHFLESKLDKTYYSMGKEDPAKISFLKTGQKADVKFAGEYLAEGASLSRGYVVLYNYCEYLKEAHKFLSRIQAMGVRADRKKTVNLYLFGDEKKGRRSR